MTAKDGGNARRNVFLSCATGQWACVRVAIDDVAGLLWSARGRTGAVGAGRVGGGGSAGAAGG
ncbi:hypothetical protein KBI5_21485, partial [Frankia sp. KB5]